MIKVYLAGPDVFLPDAMTVGRAKKAACAEIGWHGLFPLDNEVESDGWTPAETADAIYRANLAMMGKADVVLANMTPFRGPGMDGGTAFEMGFMRALGKPVFGYAADGRDYAQRVFARGHAADPADERDRAGLLIERFGLGDNLMMACAVRDFGLENVVSADDAPDDFAAPKAFRMCLNRAKALMDARG